MIEIKGYVSSDVDLGTWTPDDLSEVYFPVHLDIGRVGEEAAAGFQVLVATPEGLRRYADGGAVAKRSLLVLSQYSVEILEETLQAIVSACAEPSESSSWNRQLGRYFHWEYEPPDQVRFPGVLTISALDSDDVGLWWWEPELHEDVYFELKLEVTDRRSANRASFMVRIATPEGLRKHATGPVLSRRATIVVAEYSFPSLRESLEEIVETCAAESWTESVERLERYFLLRR